MELKELLEKRTALVAQIDGAADAEALDKLQLDLRKLDMQITEARAAGAEKTPEQKAAEERSANTEAEIPGVVTAGAETRKNSIDASDTLEYRVAFANFVTRGIEIPMELRTDATTATTDVGSVIPTTIANKIIEKIEIAGRFLNKVTKTAFAAGYAIPTSSVKPVATWVLEGASSDKQKKTTGSITFSHFKLRCEIAMTMEVSVTTLPIFESTFTKQVSEAMIKAQEEAIFVGNGTTQPKGFLTETVEVGQNIDITEGNSITYADLLAMEAALPEEYEDGTVWVMPKKTFYNQVIGMLDDNKQPVARVTVGIDGKPEHRILGREVMFTKNISQFATAVEEDTIVATIFNFSDYAFNTMYDMGISRKQDWDTEDMLTKAVLACDGKTIDKNSLVTMTIKKTL